MHSIRVFIISWPKQHENAIAIAKSLCPSYSDITIIYSDPDPDVIPEGNWRRLYRAQNSYWGDKFATAIHNSHGKSILIIHADCHTNQWLTLTKQCCLALTNPEIAVYSPYVLGSPWSLKKVRLHPVQDGPLVDVAQFDGLVFGLSDQLIKRMLKVHYHLNPYGWGIDWFIGSASHTLGLRIVMDTAIRVLHKRERGYSGVQAAKDMEIFLRQLNSCEIESYKSLSMHVRNQKI